jgi:hypothetical protein
MSDGASHNPFSGIADALLLAAGGETSFGVVIDDAR